ncbi:MAG TPA: hypothetical protein DCZ94_09780 [Lentisphaeria bacterium]|nr:MAG: hypothetical protein A2X48_19020 [Lentisphaerae bacterium GWF2_49_21]HBC87232.1 hypothetical protein [Lentisphaeria bacterium]
MNESAEIQTTGRRQESVLVYRDVRRTLFSMAFPMLAGTFAINAYSLTDMWFISRLGTLPMAAIGFTFPVIMFLTFIAGGIGNGVMTLVSHSLGRNDHGLAARITSYGILMMASTTLTLSIIGYFTVGPVFTWLGADDSTLPLIRKFMGIWYLGAITMAIPMMGNGILISSGDSKAASRIMMTGPIVNIILNPILIFGYFGFPAMGIAGSATATVIAQLVSVTWLLMLLQRKHRLLDFKNINLDEFKNLFQKIMSFGIPSMLSMVLMPISSAVIIMILSSIGNEAVAAAGVAGRIEMFAFIIPMSLGMSLTPFISQNFGAGRIDRIKEAMDLSTRFAMIYGIAIAVIFFLSAPLMASAFTSDPKVSEILVSYIRIISFGYGMMEVHRYCGFVLTGLHRPKSATMLNTIRVLVLLIPLSYLGLYLGGVKGVFIGRLATDLLAGGIGLIWAYKACAAARANAVSLQKSQI